MTSITCGDLQLSFDPVEQATADLISKACTTALPLIQQSWGLGAPADCRIYVMTSWPESFWREIDATVIDHFEQKTARASV